MNLIELFSAEAEKTLTYIQDLAAALLTPRKYVRKVAEEPWSETLRRLVVYVLGFAILEIAVQKAAMPRSAEISVYEILGVGLFETAFSLLFFPIFLATALFVRVKKPLKTAFVYSLSSRLICLVPTVICYGLFLLTEDYLFALLKGVLAYVFALIYILVLPAALSKSLKQRGLALLLALVTACVTLFVWAFIASKTSTSTSSLEQYSVLYDPIGAEVEALEVRREHLEEQAPLRQVQKDIGDSHHNALRDLQSKLTVESFSSGATFESLTSQALKESPQSEAVKQWPQTKIQLLDRWERERGRLKEQRQNASFNTTRKFVDFRLNELQRAEEVATAIDLYLQTPSQQRMEGIYSHYLGMQEATLKSQDNYIDTLSMRVWLLRLHLII